MELWSDLAALISALGSQDSWTIRQALSPNTVYIFGAVFLALSGMLLAWIYHHVPVIERYFERTVMVTCYLLTAAIIFWGVIDRFVFSNQQPWSTTIPPFLFMIMALFGGAYNIRMRTHLSFSEFRMIMPRTAQFACLPSRFRSLVWLRAYSSRDDPARCCAVRFELSNRSGDRQYHAMVVPVVGSHRRDAHGGACG